MATINPPRKTDPVLDHPRSTFIETAFIKQYNMPVGEMKYLDFVLDPPKASEPGSYSEMSLKINQIVFELKRETVQSEIDPHQVDMMKRLHGLDMVLQMKGVMISEDKQSLERQIVKMYTNLGTKSNESMKTPRQIFFQK